MSTHAAVVTASIRGPLQVIQVPTVRPGTGEVLVKVEWTASTPLDLHQNDGGLMVVHPQVLGDSVAGTVVEVGDGLKRLKLGDRVFGFGWRSQKEKAQQELATFPEYLLGKIPPNITTQEAATLPNNFVTVFHAVTADLSLPLPWPRPSHPPEHAKTPILIWGASSSVGQYALQILTYYGYTNLLGTASPQHHAYLRTLGASTLFDYRRPSTPSQILHTAGPSGVPFILDCIGHTTTSLLPLTAIASPPSKVAVLLPLIITDASAAQAPEYAWDAAAAAPWAQGVRVRGVRTHFYLENGGLREGLQSVVMPAMVGRGAVRPNRVRVVEGETLGERAERAMGMLRGREVSGERLVWRVVE